MITEIDVTADDGRILHAFAAPRGPRADEAADDGRLVVMWHHGSPQTGALLPPLLDAADARGIRLISYARPSYGGSTGRPGRDVASAAADARRVADALGVDRFAVMGASGGGPHALACAALLGHRVVGAVSLAGLAPLGEDLDWYGGMAADGALRSAEGGREARTAFAETEVFVPEVFVDVDWATLKGSWASLDEDVARSEQWGQDGLVDDDVAFVRPWGFDPSTIDAPTLLVHGGRDRMVPPSHSLWLAEAIPDAELWLRPEAGHVSVLDECPAAMDWLLEAVAAR